MSKGHGPLPESAKCDNLIRLECFDQYRKAGKIHIKSHTFYFSYDTIIAYEGPRGRARLDNYWGQVTGKHMNQLKCKDFPIVNPDNFYAVLDEVFSTVDAAYLPVVD